MTYEPSWVSILVEVSSLWGSESEGFVILARGTPLRAILAGLVGDATPASVCAILWENLHLLPFLHFPVVNIFRQILLGAMFVEGCLDTIFFPLFTFPRPEILLLDAPPRTARITPALKAE